jgi:hypothetical protein
MKVNRKELLQQLKAVSPGFEKNLSFDDLPRFMFHNGKVSAFRDGMYCTIDCCLKLMVAVPADAFLRLLGKMTEEEIAIAHVEDILQVVGKNKRAKLVVQDVDELLIEDMNIPDEWRVLPEEFVIAIKHMIPCAGKDDEVDDLSKHIHIHPEWVEASDGFQIGRQTFETGFEKPVLILAETLKRILGCDMQEVSEDDAWLHFLNPLGLQISCRKCDDNQYQDFGDVFEREGIKTKMPKRMIGSLDLAAIFSEGECQNQVHVKIEDSRVTIKGIGTIGTYEERQKVNYNGDVLSFLVSVDSFRDVLSKAKTCEVGDDFLKVEDGNFVFMTQLEAE